MDGKSMQISVVGRNIDIGDSLRHYINEGISKCLQRYPEIALSASIAVSKENQLYTTSVVMHTSNHSQVVIKAQGVDADPYTAVNQALARIGSQIHKHRGRIIHHHKNHNHEQMSIAARKYTIANEKIDEELEEGVGAQARIEGEYTDLDLPGGVDDFAATSNHNPTIISERKITIPRLSVKDAVMRMELLGVSAYMFIDKIDSHICMLYYRKDGNISWVDSGQAVEDFSQSET